MKTDSIVIAAKNEASNIAQVVSLAKEYGDVIVVDDASSDDTAAIALMSGAIVLRHKNNTHIKQAYVDGFREAVKRGYDRVIQMDAGFSHDPEQIPRLLAALKGTDLVIGSRFMEGGSSSQDFRRRALSRAGRTLIKTLTGMPFADPTSGFKAYRGALLKELDVSGTLGSIRARAHAFQFELLWRIWRKHARIKEVPISHVSSNKSMDWRIVWEALKIAVSLRQNYDERTTLHPSVNSS